MWLMKKRSYYKMRYYMGTKVNYVWIYEEAHTNLEYIKMKHA